MTLLYQVVKLFVFNRLTPKLLKSTPGVDPAYTKDLHLSGSNVYSPSELVLLGWYTYHYLQIFPGEKHVLNFEQDLHDCRVFGAVIANHVPSLARTLASLKKADAKEDRQAPRQADQGGRGARGARQVCRHVGQHDAGHVHRHVLRQRRPAHHGLQLHLHADGLRAVQAQPALLLRAEVRERRAAVAVSFFLLARRGVPVGGRGVLAGGARGKKPLR